MNSTLLERPTMESLSHLEAENDPNRLETNIYRCPNCGAIFFAPTVCSLCNVAAQIHERVKKY